MAEQLSKVYDPKTVEEQVNEFWLSNRYFHADPARDGERSGTFTIVIPPPNVTAALHLGHALNNTLQPRRGGAGPRRSARSARARRAGTPGRTCPPPWRESAAGAPPSKAFATGGCGPGVRGRPP